MANRVASWTPKRRTFFQETPHPVLSKSCMETLHLVLAKFSLERFALPIQSVPEDGSTCPVQVEPGDASPYLHQLSLTISMFAYRCVGVFVLTSPCPDGRQPLYFGTYAVMTAFNVGATFCNSIGALIVLRFFAGAFGSCPLVVAGGVIADMFEPRLRGLAIAAWSACAFIGPAVSFCPF